jgi:hypothetical protein
VVTTESGTGATKVAAAVQRAASLTLRNGVRIIEKIRPADD